MSEQADPAAATEAATVAKLLEAIEALTRRIGDLEDAVAEAVEEIGKTRRAVSELKHSAATRKQVKKLKKVLDQLEVLEVGDGPSDAVGADGKS